MDVTPIIPEGKKVINGYGAGEFTVNGEPHAGSVIILPDAMYAWNAKTMADITEESLSKLWDFAGEIEVLLLGCGENHAFLEPEIEDLFRKKGIVVDTMDTGAACRTYNVLLSEERHIAAALIAV